MPSHEGTGYVPWPPLRQPGVTLVFWGAGPGSVRMVLHYVTHIPNRAGQGSDAAAYAVLLPHPDAFLLLFAPGISGRAQDISFFHFANRLIVMDYAGGVFKN